MAVVVDLDRVGVRQPGGRLHLALEPGQGDRVGPGLGLDQLRGAGALQQLVLGEVDLAHPPFAQLADELVLAELAGLVQLGAQAVQEERAVDRQRRTDRQEQDVRAGLLGRAELRDDRGGVGMQPEQKHRGDRTDEHRHQHPRGDRRRVRDERPVDHHQHQHLDHAVLDEGQDDRQVLGAAVHQVEADEVLGDHQYQRQPRNNTYSTTRSCLRVSGASLASRPATTTASKQRSPISPTRSE